MGGYLLAGKEEEDVASSLLAEVDLHHRPEGRLDVVSLWLWREEYLHRVGAARDALHVEFRQVPMDTGVYMYICMIWGLPAVEQS